VATRRRAAPRVAPARTAARLSQEPLDERVDKAGQRLRAIRDAATDEEREALRRRGRGPDEEEYEYDYEEAEAFLERTGAEAREWLRRNRGA